MHIRKSANGKTFKSSRIRTVNRRSRLIALARNQIVWDDKEPMHSLFEKSRGPYPRCCGLT